MPALLARRGAGYRVIAAVLVCLELAACETDDHLTTGSIGAAAPRAIAFDSIDGPPPEVFNRLVAQLSAQAETRDLPVVSRTNAAVWRVRLYLAAHVERKQAGISWVADVFDTRLNRAYRVSGEEPLGPGRKDVWTLADNAALSRIAASSLDAIMSGARTPAAEPSAAPEPQDMSPREPGTPVAALPAQAVAFNTAR
jgi:hypothetical protein